MKWKQILAIVLISAATTGVTMWGVNHFGHDTYVYQKEGDTGKIPANYAGFNGVAGQNVRLIFQQQQMQLYQQQYI
jgi:serine protease Do